MSFRKLNVVKELRRIKRATADPRDRAILQQAEACVKFAVAEIEDRDEVMMLERLYHLEDTRDGGM